MSHTQSARKPLLISADSRFRSILARADGDAGAARQQQAAEAPPPNPSDGPGYWAVRSARAWREAVQDMVIRDRRCRYALLGGFVAAFATVLAVSGLRSARTFPVTVAAASSPAAVLDATANRSAATFAAPTLRLNPVPDTETLQALPATSQPALAVAEAITAPVGQEVPFPLTVNRAADARLIRIRDLPRYAGLSAGTPQEGGGWLIDAAATLELKLTAYAVQATPLDVSIELLGADGQALASAHTWITVSAAAETAPAVVQTAAAASTPAAAPVPSQSMAAAVAVADRPAPVDASLVAPPQPAGAAPRKEPRVKPQASQTRSKAKPAAPAGKAAKAEPKPAVARPVKRPAPPVAVAMQQKQSAVAAPLTDEAKRPPWSNSWMRSTLGMAQNGP